MKKVTVNDCDQMQREADQRQRRADEERSKLEIELGILKGEAQAAADAGAIDEYKAKTKKADDVAMSIFVLKSKKPEKPVTEEMAREAWANYSADYNKAFDAKYKAFERAKDQLISLYRELLQMQTEAFLTRERLADYIDFKHGFTAPGLPDEKIDSKFPCHMLPYSASDVKSLSAKTEDPDAIYYLLSRGKAADFDSLINDREPVILRALLKEHRVMNE